MASFIGDFAVFISFPGNKIDHGHQMQFQNFQKLLYHLGNVANKQQGKRKFLDLSKDHNFWFANKVVVLNGGNTGDETPDMKILIIK